MDKVLVDTSVIIEHLRIRDKSESTLYRLTGKTTQLYISIITHTELYAGKSVWEKKIARTELDIILSGLTIVPLGPVISERAGKIRAHYPIHLMDAIIAATALTEKIPLATINRKDFQPIQGVELYES